MVIENKYLRKAIEKTKYIVLVKRYIIDMPGSSLVYVSPNASEIGMNVEMLNKGMKLSEDYIYPSDREMVMKTIHNAIDNRVQDYVHEYRMVGDDGVLRQVRVNICIEVVSEEENTYEVEFYIRDISAEKEEEKQAEIKRAIEEPNRRMQISPTGSLVISKLDNPGMIPQIQKMEMIMSGFHNSLICILCLLMRMARWNLHQSDLRRIWVISMICLRRQPTKSFSKR